jgi:hypothetical protein
MSRSPNLSDYFMVISIPFASLKAQNGMKRIGAELYFYYSTAIGITVNYKSRGGAWAAPLLE